MPKPKRITRKYLRKNEVAEFLRQSVIFVKNNPEKLKISAGVFAGALLLIWGVSFFVNRSIQGKEDLFVQTLNSFHYSEGEERWKSGKIAVEGFLAKHSRGDLAKVISYYKGLAEKGLKDYKIAEKTLSQQKGQDNWLSTPSLVNIANIYEEKADYQKAIDTYKKVQKDQFLYEYASFRIAKCYDALGKKKEAQAIHKELKKIDSEWLQAEGLDTTPSFGTPTEKP
ncbi:MAG: tetratricopeptide repeat protein [bacterium]|nr:tetratricopeptide repeat protein [bacterium]